MANTINIFFHFLISNSPLEIVLYCKMNIEGVWFISGLNGWILFFTYYLPLVFSKCSHSYCVVYYRFVSDFSSVSCCPSQHYHLCQFHVFLHGPGFAAMNQWPYNRFEYETCAIGLGIIDNNYLLQSQSYKTLINIIYSK